MPPPPRSLRRLPIGLAALCCIHAALAAEPTLPEPSCLLACKSSTGCSVQRDGGGPTPSLSGTGFLPTGACDTLKVTTSEVVLRYRHKGKWFDPPMALTTDRHLKDVFGPYRADVCGVPTLTCLQQRMGEKASSTAGHGVDSLATNPAGTGNPCVLGLPCGTVLPPPAQWQFRLVDPAAAGRWQARYLRGAPAAGQPAELSADVAQGQVLADGSYFQPGAVIGYRLLDAGGTQRASGEFEIASNARVTRLKAAAAARAERFGLSPAAAWIDALAAAELDWDVQQLLAAR